jgi:CPA2 family monovalent cation:H+ antiporter-2
VQEALTFLVAFVVFATLFARLGLGTVLGFLIGGAVVGPSGLALVHESEGVHLLAELGVAFLLFNLGLELKFERLRLIETRVYLLATSQLAITGIAIAGIGRLLGLGTSEAVVLGGALALSSTAVVLQVLADLGRTLTQMGRVAIAILLVQDLAVGPLLVLVEAMSRAGDALGPALLLALAKGVVVVVVVVVAARHLLRPVLGFVAGLTADEVFTATALLLVVGASYATEAAGLSMALGAFVAGLMVADTEYRHQVAADVGRFRGLLLGLFFMSVGMTVDLAFALAHLGQVIGVALALMALKCALLTGLALAARLPRRLALELGGLLGQGSEFAFVLLALASLGGVVDGEVAQLLTVSVTLSMAITSLGAGLGRPWLDRLEGPARASLAELDAKTATVQNHLVIVGFGQVGMALARHLVGLGIPVLALDYDPKRVRASQSHGLPVYFGNGTRTDVLRAAHVGDARLVVVALPSRTGGERVARTVRAAYPKLPILARVPDTTNADAMRAAGADAVVVDGLTTARDLAERAVLLYEPTD